MDTPIPMDTRRHTLPIDVGIRLREARHRTFYTIREFAAVVGIDKSYLIRLENGDRAPSTTTAYQLIDVLGIDGDSELAVDLLRYAIEGVGNDR